MVWLLHLTPQESGSSDDCTKDTRIPHRERSKEPQASGLSGHRECSRGCIGASMKSNVNVANVAKDMDRCRVRSTASGFLGSLTPPDTEVVLQFWESALNVKFGK